MAMVTSMIMALAVPSAGLATLTEVGQAPGTSAPSCPGNPCLAVSRTTGFQAKLGTARALFTIPRNGTIVAWTITLGKPNAKQIAFFNANEGGPAMAGIAVMRGGPHLTFRLLAQSPLVALQPFFGQTAQFPLANTIPVLKGQVVALTVPSWAPALALGFGNDTSWRASRPRNKCSDTTTQTVHTTPESVKQYFCLYRTARLTYSATLISTP
jgi:hypothetical protein